MNVITLVLMFLTGGLMGGLVEFIPPFLFVKTIEKVIKLCTVLIFFSGGFEDMVIFHVFNLVLMGRGVIYIHNR